MAGAAEWTMSFTTFDGIGYQTVGASSSDLLHWDTSTPGRMYSPRFNQPPLNWSGVPGDFDYGGAVGRARIPSCLYFFFVLSLTVPPIPPPGPPPAHTRVSVRLVKTPPPSPIRAAVSRTHLSHHPHWHALAGVCWSGVGRLQHQRPSRASKGERVLLEHILCTAVAGCMRTATWCDRVG